MTVVTTTSGRVQGLDKAGVLQFRGVPFARADRFQAPEPPEPWAGVRVCDTFAPVAPQGASSLPDLDVLGSRTDPYDETACLALNVFTPAADDRRRPVMVWIHGGAFMIGTGSTPWYNGSFLARRGDVVVVTINYRLGPFGFLHLDEFPGSGNNGIRDQIAALRWVRDNIAAFGGDPDRVTIFGESAGGMSVATLLGTPDAEGLFHGAIAQSGAVSHVVTADEATARAARFVEQLGGSERLLAAPAAELLDAQARLVVGGRGDIPMPFSPVVDGVVLPDAPLAAVAAGRSSGIPVLAGTTADEYRLFAAAEIMSGGIDDATLRKRADKLFAGRGRDAIDVYRRSHPEASAQDLWCAMATDWTFRIPAVRLAEAHSGAGGQHWLYLFSYGSAAFGGVMGACHAIDIPFVFDNLSAPGLEMLLGPLDGEAQVLAAATAGSWLAMARTGDPGHDGLPEWPTYRTDRRAVMELGRKPALLDDPGEAERQLWAEFAA